MNEFISISTGKCCIMGQGVIYSLLLRKECDIGLEALEMMVLATVLVLGHCTNPF